MLKVKGVLFQVRNFCLDEGNKIKVLAFISLSSCLIFFGVLYFRYVSERWVCLLG